ncbi:MAG TPA: 30S ribosomal protein S6 [Candidatus Paceibacterota bacterium]|nr:30S ribosomal protein S6 [Candidatus Paceibacterota bacterium]
MSDTDTRAYELGYLLVPTATEAELPGLVDALKGSIKSAGGEVKTDGGPEFIDLAYKMERHMGSTKVKYSQGNFGWIKFVCAPEGMSALKKSLDGMDELARYLIIKTSLENTVAFKKPKVDAKRESAESIEVIADQDSLAESDEEMKEDHEKLPDVADDIIEKTPSADEAEEKKE